jgi:CDP-glucose 4,6-dehydratase
MINITKHKVCLDSVFAGKRVLITGHTGFKGSWLSLWLMKLGANVIGASISNPTVPCHFELLEVKDSIGDIKFDVRDFNSTLNLITKIQPDFIFHLAAQSLVAESYVNPIDTFNVNTLGTGNILEALRLYSKPVIAMMITSDKCYENIEQVWGYRENDRIGGRDPYSASKGAAELLLHSYIKSFFIEDHPVKIGICRAGNVIGGGDWANNRIVPDAVRAWSSGSNLVVRNPQATRPWQNVLEPISGYLTFAARLYEDSFLHGEAFNFGPNHHSDYSVEQLLNDIFSRWSNNSTKIDWLESTTGFHEAKLLKLCCDKATNDLGWASILTFEENIELTAEWYENFYTKKMSVKETSMQQIEKYQKFGSERNAPWS